MCTIVQLPDQSKAKWLGQFGVEGNFSEFAGREAESPLVGREYPPQLGSDYPGPTKQQQPQPQQQQQPLEQPTEQAQLQAQVPREKPISQFAWVGLSARGILGHHRGDKAKKQGSSL